MSLSDAVRDFLSSPWARWAAAVLTLIGGLIFAGLFAGVLGRALTRRKSAHVAALGRKISFYLLAVVTVLAVLEVLQVALTTFLAAAGVLGVALAFAAQTSFSNIISGLFLVFEGSFKVGDVVRVADVVGVVLSIDPLSVKIRTFDNLLVRVPNESLIKANLTNLTRYDIRRLELKVTVGYGTSLPRALALLQQAAEESVMALKKPDPVIAVDALADSGVDIVARIWVDRADFLAAKSALLVSFKETLEKAGIEIAFPHRKIVTDAPRGPAASPGPR